MYHHRTTKRTLLDGGAGRNLYCQCSLHQCRYLHQTAEYVECSLCMEFSAQRTKSASQISKLIRLTVLAKKLLTCSLKLN